MSGRGAGGDGLHLLEVGVRWPPETFVKWKLQELARRGYRVVVASPVDRRGARAHVPGVELMRVPHWDESRAAKLIGGLWDALRLLLRDPRRLRALLRSIRASLPAHRRSWRDVLAAVRRYGRLARERPDVVHFEWESAAVDHIALLDVWECPMVLSCHGAGVNRHPLAARWRERMLAGYPHVFGRAAVVHCVAEAVADRARDYGLDPAKARIIYTGVDPAEFHPGPGSGDPDATHVVGVARLIWSKGYEYALLAVRRLLDEGVPVRYDIVGGDPRAGIGEISDRPRILHTIDDLGLEGHVRLRGKLESADVHSAHAGADVFLHASLSDGLPTAIVEAMSSGLPVVVTDVGGTRELVRDGVDGFVVAPRDVAGMAAALRRLAEDPELRQAMGRSGRERILTEFTLDRHVDRFSALYAEVAGNGRAA